jgi:hypothetical protein
VINLIRVLRCEAINRRYCGYEIFTFFNLFRQPVKLAEVYFGMAEHFVSMDCSYKDTWNSQREPSLLKLTFQKRLQQVVTTGCSSFHRFDSIEDVGFPFSPERVVFVVVGGIASHIPSLRPTPG